MLGPLPTIYRVIVSVCALLSFVGIGAWLSLLMPEVFVAAVGTGHGHGLGVVAVLLLLHQPVRGSTGHRVRVRPHRHR